MRTSIRRSLLLATGALLALAAQAAPAPAAVNPIRVGLILPLTGGSSDFGNSARLGAELAVKEINEVGGFLGRPIQLVQRDDQSKPELGLEAAQDLVLKKKADFTLGYCNTGVAMKSLDVFQDNKHLLMVPCATGTAVTAKYPAAQSMIFRMAPRDSISVNFLVHEIVDRRKIREIAIFADQSGYGEGGLKDALAELEKLGIKPVHVARFALGVESLVDEMKQARDAGAQAVLSFTVGPEHAVAAKSRAEIGWKAPYFAPWPLSAASVLAKAGAADVEGLMMVQTIAHDTSIERRSSFLARYQAYAKEKRIGSLMSAAQSYDAMHLMMLALFRTRGDTSGPALKNALETLERPHAGVVTTYDAPFSSADHDAFTENMIWLGVWRKGEVKFYYPDDALASGMVRRKVAGR